jgi:hypothetical protein
LSQLIPLLALTKIGSRSDVAITRGPKGLFPCTICLVPQGEQTIIGNWKERTAEDSRKIYDAALRMFNTPGMKTAAEKLLKNSGMRFVKVCKHVWAV